MIISHQYKYVFIQNARTASTSMGKELRECYAGEKILWKHALYSDFLKQASKEEKKYFSFTGQKNPLDALVTRFLRAKYQKLEKMKKQPDSIKWKSDTCRRHIKKWQYISENDLTFTQYFNQYHSYKIDRSYLKIEREKMNFVYRYENLQKDFSKVLKLIGIRQKRELPQHSNKTQRKQRDFYKYYTPDIQRRVGIVFDESFREMGYTFPDGWPRPNFIDYAGFYRDHVLRYSYGLLRGVITGR